MLSSLTRWNRARRRGRRARVARQVAEATSGTVQRGPFAGMTYPAAASAGSTLGPKLLGTYELEIHPWLEAAIARAPSRVVNPGAGEGYYAVGLALRLPGAIVRAFESDAHARELCRAMAVANGVAGRVSVGGFCGQRELRDSVSEPALVVCDIEGGEMELLDPERVPGLRSCEIIVEIHGRRSAGRGILDRFRDTHEGESVRFRRRAAGDAGTAVDMPRRDLAIAVDERRRHGLEWLHLVPRA